MTRYDWRKSPLRRRLFFALGFGKVWGQADAVRFLSRGEATTSYHAARGLVAIIPNGIDIESSPTQSLRDSARSTLGIPSSASVLLFLGRITHQKGVKEALAAFELAAKSLPDLFFLLVGPSEGNYGREVNSFIEQSPVRNRILAPGVVTGNAKTTCFRAADAFISLSHNEGMSLALLEALSYSLPLVLTQASNLDRLAEYDAGIFTSHEPEAAATAILRIMQDPSFRQSASHQAKRLAQEVFAWAIVIPQLVAMYQDRIDNKNKI
jgi:poly(glycerol-phosphate) alpha-glucosyltransferase